METRVRTPLGLLIIVAGQWRYGRLGLFALRQLGTEAQPPDSGGPLDSSVRPRWLLWPLPTSDPEWRRSCNLMSGRRIALCALAQTWPNVRVLIGKPFSPGNSQSSGREPTLSK